MSGRWADLREAAELLGTSTEAAMKRAARGSLRSDRQDGRVLVWMDKGRTEGGREAQVDHEALLEAKDETICIFEEQLRIRGEEIRRRDVIISQLTQANAALAQRVPELEAPQEPRGASDTTVEGRRRAGPVSPPEALGRALSSPESPPSFRWGGSLTRPWWMRVFGG